jgi:ribosomal protein L31E
MAKKKESKVEIERTYNVPSRKGFRHTAKYKKTAKAMRTLQEFLKHHLKTDNVKIGGHLNMLLWENGIRNPPHHVKVHAWISEKDGKKEAKVELEGFEFKGAIQAEKKKEPETMKDKLAAKLGVDAEAKPEEQKEDKKEEKKPEEKQEAPATPATAPVAEKKEEPAAEAKPAEKKPRTPRKKAAE